MANQTLLGVDDVEWIKVSDRLPDDDVTVLIYVPDDNDPVWLGYTDEDGWRYINGASCRPTHWAEIPEPPVSDQAE